MALFVFQKIRLIAKARRSRCFLSQKRKRQKNDLTSGLLWAMNKSLWYDYRKYF